MSNAQRRKELETKNLFADPKYCRQAWKSVGQAILQNPCTKPIPQFDKDGNDTFSYKLEQYCYNKLAQDIHELGKEDREPTELEMIMQCQIAKARFDTSAATFVRDTLGAKPVDESKVDASINNPYESLSDEELELLAKHRDEQEKNNDSVRESNAES
jgi:hypothetical protein